MLGLAVVVDARGAEDTGIDRVLDDEEDVLVLVKVVEEDEAQEELDEVEARLLSFAKTTSDVVGRRLVLLEEEEDNSVVTVVFADDLFGLKTSAYRYLGLNCHSRAGSLLQPNVRYTACCRP